MDLDPANAIPKFEGQRCLGRFRAWGQSKGRGLANTHASNPGGGVAAEPNPPTRARPRAPPARGPTSNCRRRYSVLVVQKAALVGLGTDLRGKFVLALGNFFLAWFDVDDFTFHEYEAS